MEYCVSAKIKLLPDEEQKLQLIDTLRTVKSALNYTSQIAYDNNLLSTFTKLQKLVYSDLRKKFSLKSQMACNVCSVVAGSYASMKANNENTLAVYKSPKFQYSYNRDYSFLDYNIISIGALNGRIKIPYITKGLEHYFDGTWKYGTGTLVYKKGRFYLHIAVKKEISNIDESKIKNIVGIDVGMNFTAVAINSRDKSLFISGRHIKNKRATYLRNRKQLQKSYTKSAKRKLKNLSQKENRWMTDLNHKVSKALLDFTGENSLIVLEDLTNINLSCKVRKDYRYYRISWAFAQLRQFVEYKAKNMNIKVISVDPKYTSQKCPKCGYTHKSNRNKSTNTFTCNQCGYTSNDDRIGAMNLKQMGIEYHHSITI